LAEEEESCREGKSWGEALANETLGVERRELKLLLLLLPFFSDLAASAAFRSSTLSACLARAEEERRKKVKSSHIRKYQEKDAKEKNGAPSRASFCNCARTCAFVLASFARSEIDRESKGVS
jgi:hypothetical protein